MKPPNITLHIDELVVDEQVAADQAQLSRALHREITRRLAQQQTPLPENAPASISLHIAQALSARRGGRP